MPRSITKRQATDPARSVKPSLAVLWRTSSASSLSRTTWNAGSESPSAQATRAAVEWWASFIEAGQATTLAGATAPRFISAGALVVDHVDYWVQSQGAYGALSRLG